MTQQERKSSMPTGILFNEHGLRPVIAVPLFYGTYRSVDLLLRWLGGSSLAFASAHLILAQGALIREALQVACLALLVGCMSLLQREPVIRWGYLDPRWVGRLALGLASGFVFISTLIFTLWGLRLLSFDSMPPIGMGTLKFALLWGLMFVLVGVFEESLLRGYLQYLLTRNYGFWKAALVLSLLFTLMHAFNRGETLMGLITVLGFALLACVSLWYTGSLWWVIGFHIAWDWTQSYFYGAATSGLSFEGHLFAAQPQGSPLWSGGTAGPEGSPLVIAWMAGAVLVMYLSWRKKYSPFRRGK